MGVRLSAVAALLALAVLTAPRAGEAQQIGRTAELGAVCRRLATSGPPG